VKDNKVEETSLPHNNKQSRNRGEEKETLQKASSD